MNQPRKTTLYRIFILGITTILCLFMHASAQNPTTLPGENGQKPAIQYDYFPSRQHLYGGTGRWPLLKNWPRYWEQAKGMWNAWPSQLV